MRPRARAPVTLVGVSADVRTPSHPPPTPQCNRVCIPRGVIPPRFAHRGRPCRGRAPRACILYKYIGCEC